MLRAFVPALCSLASAGPWGQGSYKISGPLTTPPSVAGDVEDARLSPDGRRLVYLARQDDPEVAELYSVPLDGSTEAVKLSGALVAGGAIDDYTISPDGLWVVYQADQEEVHVHGLYSVPIDGSAIPDAVGEPSDSHAFLRYEISPDGRQVVFFDALNCRLNAVPIEGGDALALVSLRPGGYVLELQFSPDGGRVLYIADPDGLSGLNLYSVLADGGVSASRHARRSTTRPVRLNAPLPPGMDIFSFRIGAGGRAVFQVIGGNFDLYSVPIDGRASALRLNPIPVAGGHVTYAGYRLSADGEWVVYRADQKRDEVHELFGVPIDGRMAARKLNGPLTPEGDVSHPGFEIGPDSRSVVYLADQDTDGRSELYAVPIDASASPVELSSTPAPLEFLESFRFSPDGARVVYLMALDCGVSGLFSVPIDRSSKPVELDGPFPCDDELAERNGLEYQISPDGSRVVYLTDKEIDGVLARELYSVPIDGRASGVEHAWPVRLLRPVRLNAPLPPGGSVGVPDSGSSFAIRPDGGEVVYLAGQESASVLELFCVPIDGAAAPRKVNPPLALGTPPGNVVDAKISPDGGRVVFRADREIDEAFELFSAPITGHGRPVKIDGALQPGSSVGAFEIAAGSGRVVYLAQQGSAVRLFSAPVDRGAVAIELSGPLVAGGDVLSFHISPDGRRVAYVADQESDEVAELFCVPIDGSASPARLNPPLPPGGSVRSCDAVHPHPHAHFTSDGLRLVYLADQEADQVFELFSVAVDGSTRPVKLNATPVAGGDVVSFATCFLIGAGRVVYLADQDIDDVFELYSAPLDGSASPLRLNAPLVQGGDVSLGVDGVHLGPHGERVVYRADQDVDERYELFSVPIDGSAEPVRLNGAMIASGDVAPLAPWISPDGARVLYLADQEWDGRFELYSALIDGSGRAVRLSSLPFHSRHIEELEIDGEGRFVVYRADQDTDQVFELYVVSIDGSEPGVRLLEAGRQVESFRIVPGGGEVVFAAGLGAPGRELWAVSVRGDEEPVKLSGPMAGEGVRTDPEGIWVSHSGRHAIYLADQDRPGVLELYATALDGPRARSR